MSLARNQAFTAWIAAALWLGLIAVESTSLLSTANTGRILYPLLTFFFGPLDPVKFAYWHHLLRKAGHVIGYGMLSFLLFRAWRTTLPVANAARWSWKWCRTALVMTALVAALDEWHQSFLPSRTGKFGDVVLDTVAALTVQLLIFWLLKGWRSEDLRSPTYPTPFQ